ncbi:MAG: HD domain-containing protein [Candidatus Omnitrophota bacterium]
MNFFTQSIIPHRALFKRIYEYAREKNNELYVVGGFLRDIYLNRSKQVPDIDFCIPRGAVAFGKGLARHLKCGFVVLDPIHGCCRLVVRSSGVVCTVDIADFRGRTLAADLALRDFSVNTLCLALSDIALGGDPSASIVDLYGARLDIKRKRLRILYAKAFDDDPLRVLRAFSLSAVFGFSIDREALRSLGRKKKLLSRVSGERIRDEFFKILESDRAHECLRALDESGVLGIIFPEIRAMKRVKRAGKDRLDVWSHTLDTVFHIERLCGRMARNADIAAYLRAPLPGGRSMHALIKLAALLHDAGKPRTFKYERGKISFYGHERLGSRIVSDIARRLKLSNEEERMIARITFLHLRPGYMATMPAVTARAIFRYFRDAGKGSAAILLLALADERATSGYAVVEKIRPRYERLMFRLIRLYFDRQTAHPMKRFLTGHDIMRLGSMPPSAAVGAILKELDELQAIKTITTRSQALLYAARLIKEAKSGHK